MTVHPPRVAVLLRGHERGACGTNYLVEFLRRLSRHYRLTLFLHTWDEDEAQLSWRPLRAATRIITPDFLTEYLAELQVLVRSLTVQTAAQIQPTLPPPTTGRVGGVPKLAWKCMWHGMHHLVAPLLDAHAEYAAYGDGFQKVLSIRLDYFVRLSYRERHVYPTPESLWRAVDAVVELVRTAPVSTPFLRFVQDVSLRALTPHDSPQTCVDNAFFGDLGSMVALIRRFYFQLEDVAQSHPAWNRENPEMLLLFEGRRLRA